MGRIKIRGQMCKEEIYYPDGKIPIVGERLIHVYNRKTDKWAWLCTLCGKIMAPHKMKISHGVDGSWRVLQSKGAASRHLGSHNPKYVNHGRHIDKITMQGKTLCKKCGNITYHKKVGIDLAAISSKIFIPSEDEKYYCFDCGWLKKSDTTKITVRKL